MKSIKGLSIVFPVYNERRSIEKVLTAWIKQLNILKIKYQIIVCEDGSTDGTSEFLKILTKNLKFTLNQVSYRRGYGQAVLDGIKTAQYDQVLCVDSDGQCDPADLSVFLKHIGEAAVLIGWRTKRADALSRLLYSSLFGMLFHILFPTPIHDPSTPYVLFSKKQILPFESYLKLLREGFWWGFVATCVKKKLSLYEIPVHHHLRLDGQTQVYKFSKIPAIACRNGLGLIRLKLMP